MKSLAPLSKFATSQANVSSQRVSQSAKTITDNRPLAIIQRKLQELANSRGVLQVRSAKGGLPDDLKAGLEALAGVCLDDVKVHYNSTKPAKISAHAYAQGNEIYLAPGQEKHLAHEAWHVVQQKQGRVRPTIQLEGGASVNDNASLEREADRMGELSSCSAKQKQGLTKAIVNSWSSTMKINGAEIIQRQLSGTDTAKFKELALSAINKGMNRTDNPLLYDQIAPALTKAIDNLISNRDKLEDATKLFQRTWDLGGKSTQIQHEKTIGSGYSQLRTNNAGDIKKPTGLENWLDGDISKPATYEAAFAYCVGMDAQSEIMNISGRPYIGWSGGASDCLIIATCEKGKAYITHATATNLKEGATKFVEDIVDANKSSTNNKVYLSSKCLEIYDNYKEVSKHLEELGYDVVKYTSGQLACNTKTGEVVDIFNGSAIAARQFPDKDELLARLDATTK